MKGKNHKIGSIQHSIEEHRTWRRKPCALKVTEEIEGIVEVMLKQIKSWSNGQQCDCMRYPQEIEDNKKYVEKVWSRKEIIVAMQEIRGELQQHVINNGRKQKRTKLDAEMGVIRKQLMEIPMRKTLEKF